MGSDSSNNNLINRVVIMLSKLAYVIAFVVFISVFYYFYDDIFDFITEPESQVSIGQMLGITRQSDKE